MEAGRHGKVTHQRNRLGVEPSASFRQQLSAESAQKFPPMSPRPLNLQAHPQKMAQGLPDSCGARNFDSAGQRYVFFFFFSKISPDPSDFLRVLLGFSIQQLESIQQMYSLFLPSALVTALGGPSPTLHCACAYGSPRFSIALFWTHGETASSALYSATSASPPLWKTGNEKRFLVPTSGEYC